jgi:hypothetical protein
MKSVLIAMKTKYANWQRLYYGLISKTRAWFYALIVILIQHSHLVLASADSLDFKKCFFRHSPIFVKPFASLNARYFPSISFSYHYRPKQMYPNMAGALSSEIFPFDLLRENAFNSLAQTSLNGERHKFFISFHWNFDDIFMDNQNQYTWRMFQMRAKRRFNQMQQEYSNTQIISEVDATSLADKIEKIGAEEGLRAKLAYDCE